MQYNHDDAIASYIGNAYFSYSGVGKPLWDNEDMVTTSHSGKGIWCDTGIPHPWFIHCLMQEAINDNMILAS